jgi:hypothetical protein
MDKYEKRKVLDLTVVGLLLAVRYLGPTGKDPKYHVI